MLNRRLLIAANGLLGAVAIGGWTAAYLQRRKCATVVAALEARIDHGAVFDETTGLLNRAGTSLLATRVVNIARRDTDAVCACLVRILPPAGREHIDDDDAIAVAEASQVVFRSGDVVGRVTPDTLLVVGKGPGFRVTTVESRLAAQMLAMAPPDAPIPGIVVGVAVLHPWDDGALPELEQRLAEDMQVRLAMNGLVDAESLGR